MVDLIANLHTTARRYCIQRGHQWWTEMCADKGAERVHGFRTLQAILLEVERFRPEEFSSFAEARELLVLAGQTARNWFPESATTTEERNAYCGFISSRKEAELTAVPPLFFRWALPKAEAERRWESLARRWEITENYWYPLSPYSGQDAVAFFSRAFEENFPEARLAEILAGANLSRIYEFREDDITYLVDVAEIDPFYDGCERFTCSEQMDWLIYSSHEGSVTVAGAWLVEQIQARWPDWSQHIWKWPF